MHVNAAFALLLMRDIFMVIKPKRRLEFNLKKRILMAWF